jgi:PAS domain S-box-containing protein
LSTQKYSVATFVTLLIIGIVSLLIGLFGVVGYRYYSDRQWSAFQSGQEVGADQFQISVSPAIWSLNFPMVHQLMESPLRDPNVQGLVVELEDRTLIMARGPDGSAVIKDALFDTTGLRVHTRQLDYEGQELGRFHIYASTRLIEAELRSALWFLSGLVLLVDLALSLALYFSLRPLVLRPLRQLERYARGMSRGGGEVNPDSLRGLSFHGELEGLRHSIDVMVSEMEARNLELAQSTRRFERVIRLLPTPVALFDRAGRLLYLNDRFVATLGYTLDDIPDMQVWQDKAFPDADYRRQAAERWTAEMRHAVDNDKFIRPALFQVTCGDGSPKTVEVCGILASDVNIAVLTDVTERLQVEQELGRYREHLEELVATRTRELEQTYRRLQETEFAMNHAGIAIQWIDAASGRLLYVNERACELYGYAREQLLTMSAGELCPALSLDAMLALMPAIQEEAKVRLESQAITAAGGQVPIETVLYLQRGTEAQPGHFITFSTDITQRKAAEDALLAAKAAAEEAARTRSEFLANMSHEIRTPMNAIIGMSQLALRTELDAKQRNYIDKVHRSATALLGILNDILDFSKVEAGRLDMEKVEFRLDSVFDNLCNVIGLRAEENKLEFLLDIAPDVPRSLLGDPMRLGQILVNLAGNAVKFTEQGVVVVGCRKLADDGKAVRLEFYVRDSGIGMSEEQQSRLFGAFSQADSSITRRFGGTGLGLAISKRLIELLDGEISVTSVLGKGSTFRFSAQFALGNGEDNTWVGAGRIMDVSGRSVLVVDDNPEALEIFRDMVSSFGFAVDIAASARIAMDRMHAKTYDLLICDWKMPEMDGVQLIRTIQREGRAPSAVIMVSAYGVEELRNEAADLKLAGILPKPASPSTIHDTIVNALGGSLAGLGNREGKGMSSVEAMRFSGESVLLVEDNPINQELANDLLSSAGLTVTLAENGFEALAQLEKASFACILMDVQMPEMDGLEATRRIRQDPRFRNLPIIAMTAGAMAEERQETVRAGMDDYITKPIDVEQMFITLSRWLKVGRPLAASAEVPVAGDAWPGLDVEFGLKSVFNKVTLYRKLLRSYTDTAVAALGKFDEALAAGNRSELNRLAHTLKGGGLARSACTPSTKPPRPWRRPKPRLPGRSSANLSGVSSSVRSAH